jgi:hypothetical protein
MNTSEKLTCGDKYYFIDSFEEDDGIIIKVINSQGMNHRWHSNPIINYIFNDGGLFELGPFVSLEVDAAILIYAQHNRFAGLTPVEYLHSLGLV